MSASITQFSACALAAAVRPADERGERSARTDGMPALGEEHRRHRDDEQLLDDAGLGEAEVGPHGAGNRCSAAPRRHRGRPPGDARWPASMPAGWDTGTLTGGYLAQGSRTTARRRQSPRGVLSGRSVVDRTDGCVRRGVVGGPQCAGPGYRLAHRSVRIGRPGARTSCGDYAAGPGAPSRARRDRHREDRTTRREHCRARDRHRRADPRAASRTTGPTWTGAPSTPSACSPRTPCRRSATATRAPR